MISRMSCSAVSLRKRTSQSEDATLIPSSPLNGFQNHRRRKIHAGAIVVQQTFEILDGIQTFR